MATLPAQTANENLPRIIVVGGGAGGLELATQLGHKLGRKGKAHITLVDKARTHIWKPLLHEIAAGSMEVDRHELEYQAQGWPQPRRLILIRHRQADRPEAGGKKLIEVPGYLFQALVTSLPASTPPLAVWRDYNGRADCENVIKELQQGFALPTLCLESFWATEAALVLATLTYNLSVLFQRHLGWQTKVTIHSLRFWLFRSPGLIAHPAGKTTIKPLSATLYGGSGNGALTLDFSRSASTPRIIFVNSFKGIEAGALLRDLLGKAPVDGRGDVLLDVSTEGASTLQMRQALTGTASLRLADGSLNGIDIGAMIVGAQAASGLAGLNAKTGFSTLTTSFTIANGVAHNADLALRAPLFSVAGAGDIDLARAQIDYTLACTLALTGSTLPVRVSGPWDSVAWQVDNTSVSGAAVKEQARDKLKKAIRGLLKR